MSIRYRRFDHNENEIVAKLFARGLNHLLRRAGYPPYVDVDDAAAWAVAYERDRRAVFAHLGASGSESWLAEENGTAIGYARSILRDGVRQLTDFWVLPERQTGGTGRELLQRTFDAGSAPRGRIVVATTDGSALGRYLKSGLDTVTPVFEFEGSNLEPANGATIDTEPITDSAAMFETLDGIDRAVLGFARTADHRFFVTDRTGYLCRRHGEPIGYFYVGRFSGPIAALEPASLTGMLAEAERLAASRHAGRLLLNVPLGNAVAVRHLLSRGYRMHDRFPMLFLSDGPRPALDRYIFWSPGFC